MVKLDRTEQRIAGVLIEKQLSVPDVYPMSENALVDGCNQKSNRDPLMELATFQIAGALMAMQEKGVVAQIAGGARVAKYRHKLDEEFRLSPQELAVFAELLLRGPQAPGALKPRVARMGYHAAPEQIEVLLRALAQRTPPLVEQLPLGPRERDRRWRHRIGDGSEGMGTDDAGAAPEAHAPSPAPRFAAAAAAPGTPASASDSGGGVAGGDAEVARLTERVRVLEEQVRQLRADLTRLASPQMGD
jgi:uncharacterized protein YceH (UPF0502 family)